MDPLKLREAANGLETVHVLRRAALQKHFSGTSIHMAQWPILDYVIQNEDCTQVEIAKVLHVSPASIAISTKRLQKAGLLEKQVNQESLRQNRLRVTAKGKEKVEQHRGIFRSVSQTMFADFTEAELDFLNYCTDKMVSNLTDGKGKRLSPLSRAALVNKLKQEERTREVKDV
ncbi:MAG: MarR family winged helix-turn-helix transcriptional regulator [Christensenellaceae bacterium]|jgi:DNA-binding MarR family transcriptional regulator